MFSKRYYTAAPVGSVDVTGGQTNGGSVEADEADDSGVVPAPQGAPNIPGITWRSSPVKTTDKETKKQKVVGNVTYPQFDEKNPEAGIKQILAYPWDNAELNGGSTYSNAAEAIVSLVNTQHGTNMRNRLRQQHSGRINMQQLEAEALNSLDPQEIQRALAESSAAFIALRDRKVAELKKQREAKA